MKCANDQKVQCVVFFFTDRGTAWWETVERMLGGDMTVEQYNAEFNMVSHFAPDVVTNEAAKTDKFDSSLRLDLHGFVRAFRLTTYADSLCLAVDISLHERADPSKAAGRGSTLGQKRKVELQRTIAPQRNMTLGAIFQWHPQELSVAGWTLRELPTCHSCERSLGGCCYKCKQLGHIADFCPQKLLETTSNKTSPSL
ncbi:gag-protease polyprotein [Cucumis melo var. makuwa]|uniref:Gag-protease polyprotein n=1 Tax=Cucumis melo var. makuwa TaxID=1194695 RepID=A0A5D3D871_CUCMM|nr:gag-protease polyprotein [Cucumis melo var. makuwa]